MKLGVNIDHVATLRQARYAFSLDAHKVEPDLLAAASACERVGAHGITIHLRADRRHIQDRDVVRLRASINTKLNLEMGNTPEILDVALRVLPEEVCLVPENRAEVTTEGGLDAAGQIKFLTPTVDRLQKAGIRVSLFIEPDPAQLQAARQLGAEMVELHTGAFANATGEARHREVERLITAAEQAHQLGIQVNAGHGINYQNIALIRTIPHLAELNIGHSIISRAIFVGLERATAEMLAAMGGK
ncbi:pyridoxal phosphate biosynthetic protein PdxJ [Chthoniobacter flavus Ellin428]|uniref:Pyridoxine 5'-phosphate synthase n=1 Tax=Chthoniobacter flavus Ellin428 TaxID=497964 RepID=B4CZH4_9BACT|nr:pyridoxine 5'-phosphate synthase [Chthoniobacter flavus]EDY20138.1 pyridoxal phosphate biosynthetic protein PdxJ [Chthoniobacter flavus Ellin428]TCO94036.1 pyridoxine 5-phosphate synthase [Chthoniobacter flavus]